MSSDPGPIGIFDSGYGGLTILHGIRQLLPQYDYLYLGDNARAPYGTRSFDVVYEFTRQAVIRLFEMGCHLIILGCNTASAKALRSIQENDLPKLDPKRRVLGIIRPTAEIIVNRIILKSINSFQISLSAVWLVLSGYHWWNTTRLILLVPTISLKSASISLCDWMLTLIR